MSKFLHWGKLCWVLSHMGMGVYWVLWVCVYICFISCENRQEREKRDKI